MFIGKLRFSFDLSLMLYKHEILAGCPPWDGISDLPLSINVFVTLFPITGLNFNLNGHLLRQLISYA